MHNAVIAAKAAGVFVVVSANNNNADAGGYSPSNAVEVMTVAATNAPPFQILVAASTSSPLGNTSTWQAIQAVTRR